MLKVHMFIKKNNEMCVNYNIVRLQYLECGKQKRKLHVCLLLLILNIIYAIPIVSVSITPGSPFFFVSTFSY